MSFESLLYQLLKLIEKIKNVWDDKISNYIFKCLNCGEKFDGNRAEYFIKHQIDSKHFDYTKSKKQLK